MLLARLAEHKTVAIFIEWAARAGRIVVVRRQQVLVGEGRNGNRFDLGFDTAANRDAGFAEHDVAPRQGDGLGTGGARRHRHDDPGFGAAFQPDRRNRRVGHGLLHAKRGNGSDAPFPDLVVDPDKLFGRAHPGTDGTINRLVSTSGEPASAHPRRPTTVDIFCRCRNRRSSTRVSSWSKSSSRCPPMRTGRSNSSTKESSSLRIPLCLSSSFVQVLSASVANAVVIAMPVTTTSGKPFPVESRAIALPRSPLPGLEAPFPASKPLRNTPTPQCKYASSVDAARATRCR